MEPTGTLLRPARQVRPFICGRHGQAFLQMQTQLSKQAQLDFNRFLALEVQQWIQTWYRLCPCPVS